jgi:hypothetical protein
VPGRHTSRCRFCEAPFRPKKFWRIFLQHLILEKKFHTNITNRNYSEAEINVFNDTKNM